MELGFQIKYIAQSISTFDLKNIFLVTTIAVFGFPTLFKFHPFGGGVGKGEN